MQGVEIIFTGCFGGESKTVVLKSTNGGGSEDNFQVMIDNYYQGQIMKRDGNWKWLNQPSQFTSDDEMILSQWINKK